MNINIANFKKYISLVIISALLVVPLFSLQNITYAEGSIYFSPSIISAQKDSIITLKVKASAGEFNAAQIDIKYDPNVLQYISFSKANTILPSDYAFIQSSGEAKITLYSTTGVVSGNDLQIISYTFKALKDSTSTTVSFLPTTILVNNGKSLNADISGNCKITLAAPATTTPPTNNTPPSTPTSTPSTTSQPSSSATKTQTQPPTSKQTAQVQAAEQPTVIPPSNDKTPPEILTAVPTGYSNGLINIKITTNEPTLATVKYGLEDALYNSSSSTEYLESYYVSLDEITKTFSSDSGKYLYTVSVNDKAGNVTNSKQFELIIDPVTITFTVKDNDGNILPNAIIIVNGIEYSSDNNGVVKIEGIIPGSVAVSLKQGDKVSYIGEVTAVKGLVDQSFAITPTEIIETTDPIYIHFAVPAAIILLSLIAIALVIRKIKGSRQSEYYSGTLHPIKPWDPTANYNPSAQQAPLNSPQQPAQTPKQNNPSPPAPVNSGYIIKPTVDTSQPQQSAQNNNESTASNVPIPTPQEQTQIDNNLPKVPPTPQPSQQLNQPPSNNQK